MKDKTHRSSFFPVSVLLSAAVFLTLAAFNIYTVLRTANRLDAVLDDILAGPVFHTAGQSEKAAPDGPHTPPEDAFYILPMSDADWFYLVLSPEGKLRRVGPQEGAADGYSLRELAGFAAAHAGGRGYYQACRFRIFGDGKDNYGVFLKAGKELAELKRTHIAASLSALAVLLLSQAVLYLIDRRTAVSRRENTEKQKQFITNASHELKTPLTVITTCLKLLEMDADSREWIFKAQKQTERMRLLVEELVTLARLDEAPRLQKSDFCISEAVAETAESFYDLAETSGKSFETQLSPGLHLLGDERYIRELVSVLLDNAFKYTIAGDIIRLILRKEGSWILLQTENPCRDCSEAKLKHCFDRFYRGGESREGSGFGIGLSMAQSIVKAHKGSIKAAYSDHETILFTVKLK